MGMLGLALGLSLGVGISYVKSYAARSLTEMLDQEARTSAGCSFRSAPVKISLLTLRAVATDAALVCDGTPKLRFKKLTASFSLAKIREHKVLLTELDLIEGNARGFGPDSATYKFIGSLAAPLPPERDYPGRWKLKLQKLVMNNSKFSEEGSFGRLVARSADLVMWRTPDNNFVLQPRVKNIRLQLSNDQGELKAPVDLGELAGELYLADDYVDFRKLSLLINDSHITLDARSTIRPTPALSGSLDYNLNSESFSLAEIIRTQIQGDSKLSGTVDMPHISGQFSNTGPTEIMAASDKPIISLDKFTGNYSVQSSAAGLAASLDAFQASGPNTSIVLDKPLRVSRGAISGAFKISSDKFALEGINVEALRANLTFSGEAAHPALQITGGLGSLESLGYSLKNLNYRSLLTASGLELDLTDQNGQLKAHTNISLGKGADLQELAFDLNNYKLGSSGVGAAFFLTGTGKVLTQAGQLEGQAVLQASPQILSVSDQKAASALNAKVELKAGQLTLNLSNKSDTISAMLKASNSEGTFQANIKQFQLKELMPEVECTQGTFSINYAFKESPLRGNGNIDLKALEVGCAPYKISLKESQIIPIKTGELSLSKLNLVGNDTTLSLSGALSLADGYNLRSRGQINLSSLLAAIPSLDDLSGTVALDAEVSGPISTPSFKGAASLKNGQFSLESADIFGSAIEADLDLSGSEFRIVNLSGKVNDGSFKILGSYFPFGSTPSKITLALRGLNLEPAENANLTFSGDLVAQFGTGSSSLSGKVTVDSAELQKTLDLTTIIKGLVGYITSGNAIKDQVSSLPDINLDLQIQAERNVFVLTNWLGAELKAAIRIAGNLASPNIEGSLDALTGWFGFRDRRFEISAATISFKPGEAEPWLDLHSETNVRSLEGDDLLVQLEARGALTNPKLTLSSDSGLTQREILALLTAGNTLPGQTRNTDTRSGIELGEFTLFEDSADLRLGRLFRTLTTIDSITLEPTYNVQRGAIEPTVIATKRLSDALSLIGESFFGSDVTESNVKLRYLLTPRLSISGLLSSVSTKQQTALGADLAYTLFDGTLKRVRIKIYGNKHFENSEIMHAMRIGENSNVSANDSARLKAAIQKLYQQNGYFQTAVEIECDSSGELCSRLAVTLMEGGKNTISAVQVDGDALPDKGAEALSSLDLVGRAATQDNLKLSEATLTQRLRSEGYIGARIRANYQQDPNNPQAQTLVITSNIGRPVSFSFAGNTIFSPSELLSTINLFKRRQPFGNNTINLLVSGIERKYHEAGHLYVTIDYQKDPDLDRVRYRIEIDEGPETTLDRVEILGIDESYLKTLLKQKRNELYYQVFDSSVAIAQEVESNTRELKGLLQQEGFTSPEVGYDIHSEPNSNHLVLTYSFTLGQKLEVKELSLVDWPSILSAPSRPAKLEIPAISAYIDTCYQRLQSAGFHRASIETSYEPVLQELEVKVSPATQTKIGQITIEGGAQEDEPVIRDYLNLHPGDVWDQHALDILRARLMKLGLFSRVEIGPLDAELDQTEEAMSIQVTDRNPRSVEVGGGLNSEYGLHIFGEATERKFFYDGRALSLRLDAYYDARIDQVSQGIASIKFTNPLVFYSDYSLVEDLRYQKLDISTQEFDLDRVSLNSYFYRNWEDGLTHLFGHTILQEDLSNVSPGAIIGQDDSGLVRLSFLSGALNFDTRDSPLNPRRGYNLNLSYDIASDAIASDANYYMLGSRASAIYPLPFFHGRLSLANNLRISSAWTYGSTDHIPISQRYYLGGRTSVRGFRENSLGPRSLDGAVIGGDKLIANNLELRYLVANNTSLITFLDAGQVLLKGQNLPYDDWRMSTGVGVRYLSPIGPIGFDIGHPLDEKPGEPSVRLHFNIGATF